jgi:hypothetical protein
MSVPLSLSDWFSQRVVGFVPAMSLSTMQRPPRRPLPYADPVHTLATHRACQRRALRIRLPVHLRAVVLLSVVLLGLALLTLPEIVRELSAERAQSDRDAKAHEKSTVGKKTSPDPRLLTR